LGKKARLMGDTEDKLAATRGEGEVYGEGCQP